MLTDDSQMQLCSNRLINLLLLLLEAFALDITFIIVLHLVLRLCSLLGPTLLYWGLLASFLITTFAFLRRSRSLCLSGSLGRQLPAQLLILLLLLNT